MHRNHYAVETVKAETQDATNRGDTSRRQVATSALLLRPRLRLVCRCDMSHEFKPVRICATDRSDETLSQRQ